MCFLAAVMDNVAVDDVFVLVHVREVYTVETLDRRARPNGPVHRIDAVARSAKPRLPFGRRRLEQRAVGAVPQRVGHAAAVLRPAVAGRFSERPALAATACASEGGLAALELSRGALVHALEAGDLGVGLGASEAVEVDGARVGDARLRREVPLLAIVEEHGPAKLRSYAFDLRLVGHDGSFGHVAVLELEDQILPDGLPLWDMRHAGEVGAVGLGL